MAIVDLTTNLKSLRYGKDRPFGGSSNQPYVQRDIDVRDSEVGRTGGPDFLLRGGTLVPQRIGNDVSRLAQMFIDLKSPNGPLFIAKQNILSRTSVATNGDGKTLNSGAYLPTSTLLQPFGNVIGLHTNKQGLDPFKGIGKDGGGLFKNDPLGQPTYLAITSDPNYVSRLETFTTDILPTDKVELYNYQGGPGSILGIGKTRIPRIQNTFLDRKYTPSVITWSTNSAFVDTSFNDSINITQGFPSLGGGQFKVGTTGKTSYTSSNYKLKPKTLEDDRTINDKFLRVGASVKYSSIVSLKSGNITPIKDSFLGSGKAKTFSVYQDNILSNNNDIITNNNTNTLTSQQISDRPVSKDTPKVLEDFRTISNSNVKRIDYTRKNIEQRVQLGNPGKKKTKSQSANYSTGLGALDKINSHTLYKSTGADSEKTSLGNELNDLVKFRIGIIDNNSPGEKVYIHFRAFIDSMSDNYSSEWGGNKLMGRGENFYTYQGFDRTINLAWTVAAQSKEELIPMYQKLNYLASSLSPDYSNTGYMRGNLATLTVGGYIYEQPGIIKSINLEIPNESPWEIGINNLGGNDNSVKELPHMIKVSGFSFAPIHEFVPRLQQNKYNGKKGLLSSFGRERYIALAKGNVDEEGIGGENNYGSVKGELSGGVPNYIPK